MKSAATKRKGASDVESRLITSMRQAVAIKNGAREPAATRTVREHGMLMSGPMVRATLEDRKRMTRRVVTDRNSVGNYEASQLDLVSAWVDRGFADPEGRYPSQYLKSHLKPDVAKAFGVGGDLIVERLHARIKVGDLLWVRETWAIGRIYDGTKPSDIDAAKAPGVRYPASSIITNLTCRSPYHMPRWASRITLEVTRVRPERLHDISEDDARDEGVEPGSVVGVDVDIDGEVWNGAYRRAFRTLWNSLNAPRGYGWDANPWVWCLSFRRVA